MMNDEMENKQTRDALTIEMPKGKIRVTFAPEPDASVADRVVQILMDSFVENYFRRSPN